MTLASGYQTSGTYISPVINGGSIVDWETLTPDETIPAGSSIGYSTRTGNTAAVDSTWSDWATVNSPIGSPNSQYLQYKAVLTGTGTNTPVLSSVALSYSPIVPTTTPSVTPTPTPTSIPDTTAPSFELKKIGTVTYDSKYSYYYYTTNKVLLYGTGEKGAKVMLKIDGTDFSETPTINDNNEWSITPDLSVGVHSLQLTATDAVGNLTTMKFTLEIDPYYVASIPTPTVAQSVPAEDLSTTPNPTPTTTKSESTLNSLLIRLVDTEGNPLSGIFVTLYSDPKTGTTNSKGEVTFKNVTKGSHTLVFTYNGEEIRQTINLVNDEQEYKLEITVTPKESTVAQSWYENRLLWGMATAILLLLLIFFVIKSRKRQVQY